MMMLGRPFRVSGGRNYFGDGSDGDVVISSDTDLDAALDGDPVIRNYSSLTIDAGFTLTTDERCKGLFIYVKGDCTINGTLSMTARGASAAAIDDSDFYKHTPASGEDSTGETANLALFPPESNQKVGVAFAEYGSLQVGAAGATGNGNSGAAGGDGEAGGGGSGGDGQTTTTSGGDGSDATALSGGTGGGGGAQNNDVSGPAGGAGSNNGGSGGAGAGGVLTKHGGGGGAGNPGGAGGVGGFGPTGDPGGNGTGGFMSLVVKGNLIVGAAGLIEANGSAGGNSPNLTSAAGGGGSGGGILNVLYAGSLSNSGTLQANGGSGGLANAGGNNGGSGGAGSIRLVQISI